MLDLSSEYPNEIEAILNKTKDRMIEKMKSDTPQSINSVKLALSKRHIF